MEKFGVLDVTLRLLLATILGSIIGLEREYVGKEAGFRTHALVTLGSALIMVVSIYIYEIYSVSSDPGRIAAQVVTGVGFLGAGAIIRSGTSVLGLTTAATLWICAAIGLAAGCGFYFGAILVTVIVLVILIVFQRLESSIKKIKKK